MLRGGVVGLGRMGLTHYSILNTHPEVKFVAICDSTSFLLKNASQYMGVKTFNNYQKMINTMELDFIIVATPTIMHAEVAECAIKNNVNVFVEKPLTLNPVHSVHLVELVQDKKLVHQVGYAMRFHDIFINVKSIIDSEAIGIIVTFTVEMNGPVVLHDLRKNWRSKKSEGGGCLYDFASHSVDLVNYLIGPPDEVVGTFFNSIHSNIVEDAINSTFIYNNGTRGTLLANWSDPSYRKPSCRFEALGTKGKIIADFYTYKIFFQETPAMEGYTQGWNERYLADIAEPVRFYVRGFQFTRQLDYFIDCILEKKTCEICSFEDGYYTDQVIYHIRKDGEKRSVLNGQNYIGRQPVLRN